MIGLYNNLVVLYKNKLKKCDKKIQIDKSYKVSNVLGKRTKMNAKAIEQKVRNMY